MIEQQHKENINSEMDNWLAEIEEKKKSFGFVHIGFNIDMREAQNKFMEERKNNTGGAANLTFNQWIDIKKYEASKFYVEHSDYYLGF